MKVIVAGYAKTGTKSMCAALRELGYKVYDFKEHFLLLGDKWKKIFEEGGTTEDFRQMYEGVDAITDAPASYFWEELHKAYPDAKTVSEDKLLVFNVKEGWNPLCKFLDVEVPKTPFPHENKNASFMKEVLAKDPFVLLCKREALVSVTLITSLVAYGCYKIIRKSTLEMIKSAFTDISNYFTNS